MLSWVLTLPLAVFALLAADLLIMALEVAFEGDVPGGARVWAVPLMSVCGGFAGVFVGAKVAPDRKPRAALALAAIYLLALGASSVARVLNGVSVLWVALVLVAGAVGSGSAAWTARNWAPDADE